MQDKKEKTYQRALDDFFARLLAEKQKRKRVEPFPGEWSSGDKKD